MTWSRLGRCGLTIVIMWLLQPNYFRSLPLQNRKSYMKHETHRLKAKKRTLPDLKASLKHWNWEYAYSETDLLLTASFGVESFHAR